MNLHNVKMITESVSAYHVVGAVYPLHIREVDEISFGRKCQCIHSYRE
jgi:hypothetical protein